MTKTDQRKDEPTGIHILLFVQDKDACSYGICPECEKKLCGDFLPEENG